MLYFNNINMTLACMNQILIMMILMYKLNTSNTKNFKHWVNQQWRGFHVGDFQLHIDGNIPVLSWMRDGFISLKSGLLCSVFCHTGSILALHCTYSGLSALIGLEYLPHTAGTKHQIISHLSKTEELTVTPTAARIPVSTGRNT